MQLSMIDFELAQVHYANVYHIKSFIGLIGI